MSDYKYIFGPVPSRRLGRSLGVDLLPMKTCSFDCVFCQLGRTTNSTLQRREYVPTESVIRELSHWLDSGESADFVTLSGSGEPTLHSRFADIFRLVHSKSDISTALLTNGSFLSRESVRRDVQLADMIKVSLSAWDQKSFEKINRPHSGLAFSELVWGLQKLSQEYHGDLMIEVFLIQDFNDSPEYVSRIAEYINDLYAQRVQLNTLIRPPAEKGLKAVPENKLRELSEKFKLPVEIVTEYKPNPEKEISSSVNSILSLLQRRPCTAQELVDVSGKPLSEVENSIKELLQRNAIQRIAHGQTEYYQAVY